MKELQHHCHRAPRRQATADNRAIISANCGATVGTALGGGTVGAPVTAIVDQTREFRCRKLLAHLETLTANLEN